MLDLLDDIIRRHRNAGILLDTNVLILLLLVLWDRPSALSFKRTSHYTDADVEVLRLLTSQFNKIVVTPAVLAEVSNLVDRLPEPRRTEFLEFLQRLLQTAFVEERAVPLPMVAGGLCFVRFGFADATVEQLCVAGVPVLTDDGPLYRHLLEQQIDVVNLNDISRLLG